MTIKLNGEDAVSWLTEKFIYNNEDNAEREVAAWERIGLSMYVKKDEWYRIAA